jgi:hypothetical protein
LVSHLQRRSLLVFLSLFFHCLAAGQTIGLSMGSAAAAAGGSTSLNLSLTASAGAQAAGLEWDISYSPTDVSSITITPGAAATSAGKTVACSTRTGSMTCLLYGVNSTLISSGVVAQIAVDLLSTSKSTSTAIQISGTEAASGTGSVILTTGSGGVVTILPSTTAPTGVTCSPATFAAPGNFSCAIKLSAAAPAGGLSIGLSSSNAEIVVPTSLSIPAGSATGSFTGTVSSVATPGSTVITASAGGVTKSASIILAPTQISSLVCSEATVPSGNSTTCTVTLVNAASGSGATVSLSSGNTGITILPSVTVASGATTATFTATAGGALVQEVWVTASLNGSSAATLVTVSALQIQGDPSELSGSSNGAIVTPKVAPSGFAGQLVVAGNGVAKFAPVEAATGVSFLNCCSNTNTAHYRFTGVELGNIFSVNMGQISFSLKSSYSFAQRQKTAASPRYAFDVQDDVATRHHLFYFLTEVTSNSTATYLTFSYSLGGAAQFYFVPLGTEDTLFGDAVTLQVTITWDGNTGKLYLNGALVQSKPYTQPAATWTANSVFDLGATEYLTYGGYSSSDDLISGFTVGVPNQP